MNLTSRILILIAIFLLFFALLYDYRKTPENQDSIRYELAAKGLPTPAFAGIEELKKILKN